MTSFHAKCCHLVSAHAASARCVCISNSTFIVHSYLLIGLIRLLCILLQKTMIKRNRMMLLVRCGTEDLYCNCYCCSRWHRRWKYRGMICRIPSNDLIIIFVHCSLYIVYLTVMFIGHRFVLFASRLRLLINFQLNGIIGLAVVQSFGDRSPITYT